MDQLLKESSIPLQKPWANCDGPGGAMSAEATIITAFSAFLAKKKGVTDREKSTRDYCQLLRVHTSDFMDCEGATFSVFYAEKCGPCLRNRKVRFLIRFKSKTESRSGPGSKLLLISETSTITLLDPARYLSSIDFVLVIEGREVELSCQQQ